MSQKHFSGMVVTDLDGTLLQANRRISETDVDTLRMLEEKGIIRVIATGRSPYSARGVLEDDFPVDYLVFSSGAGIIDWSQKRLLDAYSLSADEVKRAVSLLLQMQNDFMVHEPIPDNHFFSYHRSGRKNPDFDRRRELYREFATAVDFNEHHYRAACQIIAVEPPGWGNSLEVTLRRLLGGLNVIRTTSPLDKQSVWIEIFPKGVSKAHASERIRQSYGIGSDRTLGVGNDYNDLDLLCWASKAFIVGAGPEELRSRFRLLEEENGFSQAVSLWMEGEPETN
jgi:HAD superfamily hydrolase (TIGR01484 family)